MSPQNVTLSETVKIYHEDNFARAAQFSMVWPSLHEYQKDSYALDILADFLWQSQTKCPNIPLYRLNE